MAKGNILKEAIADAKAVREVALANAKAALEEAFTPKLQNMLSARLSEDLEEDMYYDEDEKDMEEGMHFDEDEKDMEEMMYDEDEDMDEGHTDDHGMEEDSMDEEIDLEEILNELELEESEEVSEKKKSPIKKPKHGDGSTGTYTGDEIDEGKDEEVDEEIDLEELARPIYKAEYTGTNHHYTADKVHEEEEFDLDSLLKEINNLDEQVPTGTAGPRPSLPKKTRGIARKGIKVRGRKTTPNSAAARLGKSRFAVNENKGCKDSNEVVQLQHELNETKKAFNSISNELNEVNLLNSKLLYVNRIFKANTLDDSQKLRVVETLDKAESTKEAKLIYETIKDTFNVAKSNKVSSKKTKSKTIKENFRGLASKAAGKSTAPKKAILSEADTMVSRFQKLANIKINE